MKKKNEKGFVLSETVVVSVFVLGIFTYIATSFFPLISKYKMANRYDNPEEIYIAHTLLDEITLRNDILNVKNGYYKYKKNGSNIECKLNDIIEIDNLCSNDETKRYPTLIYKYLDIREILIVNTQLTEDDLKNLSRSMREYYNYFKIKNVLEPSKKYMLIKFNDNKFAGIEVNSYE